VIDYEKILNRDILNIKPSGIRKFFDIANEMDNIISLSIGEPDFQTPWHVRQSGIASLEKGRTWYSPNKGFLNLREEISKYFYRKFNVLYSPHTELVVTVGGSEAIDLSLRCLCNPGDEVIIPQPSFVCYEPLAFVSKAVPVIIETKSENDFKMTAEELQKSITPKSKVLILPYPNNPTGAILNKDDQIEIAKIVEKHNLMVISDEIYGELTYGQSHVSFSSISGMRERTVVISGFSKCYAMTGWRLGYAVGPEPIIDQMTKLHQYGIMCSPTIAQYAAIEALKNGDGDISYMRAEYDMRRKFVLGRFKEMGLPCFEPLGAFYTFPSIKHTGLSSEEFCGNLIKSKKVAVVPGNAFGKSGEGYIRVSYSYSLKHLKEALVRIESFLNEKA